MLPTRASPAVIVVNNAIGLGTGVAPSLNLSFPKIISGRNGLRRRPTLQHVFRDGRLGDLKAEHNPRHRETFADFHERILKVVMRRRDAA